MYEVVLGSADLNNEAKIVKPRRRDNRFDPAKLNQESTSPSVESNDEFWSMFGCETCRS